jgi:hypothetical protein
VRVGTATARSADCERYEDCALDDPAGQDIDHVRPIRYEIRRLVESLIGELLPLAPARSRPAPALVRRTGRNVPTDGNARSCR